MNLMLMIMLFMHVIADFNLQGILAQMKCEAWWKDKKYYGEYDWATALTMHAFSWTFLVMLPLLVYLDFQLTNAFNNMFCINLFVHFFVDDLKANRHKIDLRTDQVIHIIQIAVTYIVIVYL